jgi:aspartate/methionine/tyrosine aminotransferase
VTPGRDFGHAGTERFVRFSFANALPQLQEAVGRLRQLLAR